MMIPGSLTENDKVLVVFARGAATPKLHPRAKVVCLRYLSMSELIASHMTLPRFAYGACGACPTRCLTETNYAHFCPGRESNGGERNGCFWTTSSLLECPPSSRNSYEVSDLSYSGMKRLVPLELAGWLVCKHGYKKQIRPSEGTSGLAKLATRRNDQTLDGICRSTKAIH